MDRSHRGIRDPHQKSMKFGMRAIFVDYDDDQNQALMISSLAPNGTFSVRVAGRCLCHFFPLPPGKSLWERSSGTFSALHRIQYGVGQLTPGFCLQRMWQNDTQTQRSLLVRIVRKWTLRSLLSVDGITTAGIEAVSCSVIFWPCLAILTKFPCHVCIHLALSFADMTVIHSAKTGSKQRRTSLAFLCASCYWLSGMEE